MIFHSVKIMGILRLSKNVFWEMFFKNAKRYHFVFGGPQQISKQMGFGGSIEVPGS